MLIHDIIPHKKKMKQIKKMRGKPLKSFGVAESRQKSGKSDACWLHCGKNSPLERGWGVLKWSLFAKRLCMIFSEITKSSTALKGLWSQRSKRKLTASVLAFILILQTIIGVFTPINISVTPPYISPQETKAAGSWVVGSGGDAWSGNVTMDNTFNDAVGDGNIRIGIDGDTFTSSTTSGDKWKVTKYGTNYYSGNSGDYIVESSSNQAGVLSNAR